MTLVRGEGGNGVNGRAFILHIVERVSAPIDGTIYDQISREWTQFDVSHTELVNFLVESNNEAILNNT